MGRSLIREEQIIDADVVSEDELGTWRPVDFTVSGTLTVDSTQITSGGPGVIFLDGAPLATISGFDNLTATTSGYTGTFTVLTTASGEYEAPPATQIGFNFTLGAEIVVDESTLTFENGLLTTVE